MGASRPGRAVLQRLAAILQRRLAGTHLERVWRPSDTSLLFDFRALGKARLFVSLASRHPWIAVTTRWPETPAAPDRETLILRKCLEGARVAGAAIDDDRRLVLTFTPRAEHEPALAIQLAGRYVNAAVFDRTTGPDRDGAELVKLIADRPAIDPDSPPLPSGEAGDGDDDAWLEALASQAWAAEDERQLEARRIAIGREARAAHQRKQRAVDALSADLARADGAERVRHEGELLKGALHRVKPGMAEIALEDWYADPPGTLLVALDPTIGATENLQRIFQRYRKLVRGQSAIASRLGAAKLEADKLASFLDRLAGAPSLEALEVLERELRKLGVRAPAAPRRAETSERRPYRRFIAADGSEIFVGKSARDNDDLTFHVARGADMFLHARDVPGSHVILKRRGNAEPSSDALLDAASLAAWGSKLRGEGVVDVLYTERKHVRKPRGAAPGLVQTASTRNLVVRLDPARIERLYGTLDPHEREP